jgi:hypothetical protein
MPHEHRRKRSIGHSWNNWRDYDGPFGRKVLLVLKNNGKKAATFSQCCGHPGEPGC